MTTNITPRVGKIVLYTLSEMDVREIIQNRRNAGIAAKRGNDPHRGDTYPAIIVQDWAPDRGAWKASVHERAVGPVDDDELEAIVDKLMITASVNLQVFLDGTDTHWVTSRSEDLTGEYVENRWVRISA